MIYQTVGTQLQPTQLRLGLCVPRDEQGACAHSSPAGQMDPGETEAHEGPKGKVGLEN